MRSDSLPPMSGPSGIVEADETYLWQSEKARPRNKYLPPFAKSGRSGPSNKRAIISLVERGGSGVAGRRLSCRTTY